MNTPSVVAIVGITTPSTAATIGMKSHNFHLFDAAKLGLIDKIDLCYKKGADVNSKNAQEVSPLWEAARNGQTAAVVRLMELKGKIDIRAPNGFTPVNIATRFGHNQTVQVLCEAGANQGIKDANGCNPIWNASRCNNIAIMGLLQRYGGDVNAPDLNGRSPCWVAARYGLLDALKRLVELNADATTSDKDLFTPLHVAAQFGHTDIVIYLCTLYGYGNVDVLDVQGRSPLWIAAWQGSCDILEILAGAGAVTNRQNNEGVNPYYAAAKEGHALAASTLKNLKDIEYMWEKDPPSGIYVNPQRKEQFKEHYDKRVHRNIEYMNSNTAVVMKESP